MDNKFNNIVNLYTTTNDNIKNIRVNDNVLIFTNDKGDNRLYRGAGPDLQPQPVSASTADKLANFVKIYGNDFNGTQDVSNNLSMTGLLDNSTGIGIFNEINANDIITNNLDVSVNLVAKSLKINGNVLSFKDRNGNDAEWILDEKILDVEILVKTKVFETVDDIFNISINDVTDDEIGTTYYAKHGNSDIDIPETFILQSKNNKTGEYLIVPTSSYIVSEKELNTLYNYDKGNVLWIDKLYKSNNYNDADNSDANINDDTVITAENYKQLYNAINKLYYILGVDMDAGNVENSSNTNTEGLDAGEFDQSTPTTTSNYGVILTDLAINQKTSFNDYNTEEKPEWLAALDEEDTENGETEEDYDTVVLPDLLPEEITEIGEHFVKAIRIKRGKYSDMMDVSNCILDGELIWCKYDAKYPLQSNKLFIKSTDKFSNPQFYCINVGTDESSEEQEYLTELTDIQKIDWLTDNLTQYRMNVNNNGKLTISPLCKNQPSFNSYWFGSKNRYNLYINSLYCGGLNSNKNMFRPCSHNFIELSNLTNYDINLAEAHISLQYIDRTKYDNSSDKLSWEILPLTGTIKAGGTYLIRGAECAPMDCNTTRLKIENYDQEWYDSTGKLISFDCNNPSFTFYMGNVDSEGNYYSCTNDIGDVYSNGDNEKYCFTGKTGKEHFFDTIGIRNYQYETDPLYFENTPVRMSNYNIYSENCLFVKYFSMDNVNQAITDGYKRNNNTDIYVINLNKNYQEGIENYYSGKASFENKNIFYNKSVLDDKLPNMVFCTFGKNATDNGNGATRCFNWLSVGYYNEYLKLTYPDGTIKYFESFKNTNQDIYTGQQENNFNLSDNHYNDKDSRFSYTGIYDRFRTFTTGGIPFTVHKLIIDNLTEGKYKYQVGKMEGWSEEYTFEVLSDNTINEKFNNDEYVTFMHHSDQQGFNKDEYKAWEYVVDYVMTQNDIKPVFSINTGDMTQNGNRINEWLDYYSGGKKLFSYSECMHTVGNNDLSPIDNTKLGDGGDDSKLNPKNFDIFFCHDLTIEEQDLLTIHLKNGNYRLVPSNYSFDFANCHFICINSELPKDSIIRLFNENADEYANKSKNDIPNYDDLAEEYSSILANKIETWLDSDCKNIANYNNTKNKEDQKWIIAYCHEMPFTILTCAVTVTQQADRLNVKGSKVAGCRTNALKSNGKYYWLSRLFDRYHIPLILGGHKHTYCMSNRIKENIIINDDGTEDYSQTYKPIIQLKRSELEAVYGQNHTIDELKTLWYNTGKKKNDPINYPTVFEDNICNINDIEIIDDINGEDYSAPMYVMQTAAGYKLISNKELPSVVIPWLTIPAGNINDNTDRLDSTYFPTTWPGEAKNVNPNQLYPYFTIYKFNRNEIIGTPIRMSKTVNSNTSQIYYKGNTKAKGTYDLINAKYTFDDISEWKPDIANGMVADKLIHITNKPF